MSGRDEYQRRAEALAGDDWTPGEKLVLRWQFRGLGGYWAQLFEAACRADDENLDLLAAGYPSMIEALRSWKYGDLARRLADAGLLD